MIIPGVTVMHLADHLHLNTRWRQAIHLAHSFSEIFYIICVHQGTAINMQETHRISGEVGCLVTPVGGDK